MKNKGKYMRILWTKSELTNLSDTEILQGIVLERINECGDESYLLFTRLNNLHNKLSNEIKEEEKRNREKIGNRTIEILKHDVNYWYRIDQEMPESEQEHVKEEIIEGFSQGELNCLMPDGNTENRGWWSIKG